MALGIPITFAVTQSTYHWGPRHWVMLAGVIPNTVNILVAVMLWARSIPCALGDKASSRLHPAPRRDGHIGFECGLCDAPLRLEPDALAATCDYCAADNWLSGDHAVAQRRANEKREMRALQELIESDERQRADIRLLIIVSAIVCTLAFAGLWFALPVSV